MSCDISGFAGFLGTAEALIIATLVLLAVTIALNNSFFGAIAAPATMIAAGATALAAAGAIGGAIAYLQQYMNCLGHDGCDVRADQMIATLGVLVATLTVQATICFGSASITSVPWIGQALPIVIILTMVAQLAALLALSAFLGNFIECTRMRPPTYHLAATAAVTVLTAGIFWAGIRLRAADRRTAGR